MELPHLIKTYQTGIPVRLLLQKRCLRVLLHFAQNLVYWDVNKVTAHDNMFDGATSITSAQHPLWPVTPANRTELLAEVKKLLSHSNKAHLNYIITSNITDMSAIFNGKKTFNGDISKWDTSKVTTMDSMFYEAKAFNGDISKWNTELVTNMDSMFYEAKAFNGDISNWKTGKVTAMLNMFAGATTFNQDISGWDTSNVTTMHNMFEKATAFNQDISYKAATATTSAKWDTSNVTNMALHNVP